LSAWFLFSGELNTNVDFSDFILVKIYSKFDVRKQKLSLNHVKIKAIQRSHAKINKYSLNISASSGAKMIKIRLEMTSQ